jgi:hypothetical protein
MLLLRHPEFPVGEAQRMNKFLKPSLKPPASVSAKPLATQPQLRSSDEKVNLTSG